MKKVKQLLLTCLVLMISVFMIFENSSYAEENTPSYLTFTAVEAGSSVSFRLNSGDAQYSLNNGEWTDYEDGTEIPLINQDDKVSFRGQNVTTDEDNHFFMTGKIAASGSVTSLTDENGSDSEVTLGIVCYNSMFRDCTSLITAPELPATKMANFCYSYMFDGCTSLKEAPELPATELADSCYASMFFGCTSLKEAPELPATELVRNCYNRMFNGCTSLKEAPKLPATELAESCYYCMFGGCTSLTKAPELPATKLAYYCYSEMFSRCTSLTAAPKLPATELAEHCYYCMFGGCTSLTKAPELPATELADDCYNGMFSACTSLTEAPELPATELADSCYNSMFLGCTSLTTAPQLAATTLKTRCYLSMFYDCTSLIAAPELPATELAVLCYNGMFRGCIHLMISKEKISNMYITTEYILPDDSGATNCYDNMFRGVGINTGIPSELLPAATPTAGTYYVLANEFNIKYNLDGGTNAASNPSSYKFGTGVASFKDPAKAGYKFDGWYTDAGFTKKITSISKDAHEDYTLYAKWISTKVANTITVKDFFKDYSTKAQKIKLGAKVNGGAKLTYKSNNKKVKVDNKGTVTIPKNFCGILKITITSAETDAYLKATVTSTITLTSAKPKISKVSASKKALTLKWGKVKNADGYEITYSTDKNFAKAKKITAKKTATSTTIKKLTSKKKYYVRMRSYKKSGSKKIYSQYSAVKSIIVK